MWPSNTEKRSARRTDVGKTVERGCQQGTHKTQSDDDISVKKLHMHTLVDTPWGVRN